ncbi:DNA cytosine methyltransferase [Ramlibacter sp. WS9]|uniref:DNA cytosine methyltransferase n=1 Tax=Ramlibacter sp. WS9 TaxID=1882741 RepID=UPI001144A913|nr:DNA cytosine methyltransferase [Ramlibacter sp. WS9]ROZ66248.1 DNA cytosine methyltransferase [Ramlibacter sp. WS9]
MKYRLIDLFCGAGGMTLGFVDPRFGGSFECVFGIDSDWAAIKTHERNFRSPALAADIEAWLDQSPQIPHVDVVIGGPPCQGFSLLNKNRLDDSRRELWEPFLRVVAASGARIFVMENVAELKSSPELKALVSRASEMGFETACEVLNAADYGAPQHRKRAILVGWKSATIPSPPFPPPPSHSDPALAGGTPWRTVRDAISDLPPPEGVEIRHSPPPMNLHFGRSPTDKSVQRYKSVPPGGNRFDLQKNARALTPDCWIRKTSGGTDLFGRLWWDRPSVTIRTEFFKPEKGRYLHPVQHRPITHREAARLMGFPDEFEFVGTKIDIAKQMGNAVPPQLAGALAKMVEEMLAV